jgi:hypothetical protein
MRIDPQLILLYKKHMYLLLNTFSLSKKRDLNLIRDCNFQVKIELGIFKFFFYLLQ